MAPYSATLILLFSYNLLTTCLALPMFPRPNSSLPWHLQAQYRNTRGHLDHSKTIQQGSSNYDNSRGSLPPLSLPPLSLPPVPLPPVPLPPFSLPPSALPLSTPPPPTPPYTPPFTPPPPPAPRFYRSSETAFPYADQRGRLATTFPDTPSVRNRSRSPPKGQAALQQSSPASATPLESPAPRRHKHKDRLLYRAETAANLRVVAPTSASQIEDPLEVSSEDLEEFSKLMVEDTKDGPEIWEGVHRGMKAKINSAFMKHYKLNSLQAIHKARIQENMTDDIHSAFQNDDHVEIEKGLISLNAKHPGQGDGKKRVRLPINSAIPVYNNRIFLSVRVAKAMKLKPDSVSAIMKNATIDEGRQLWENRDEPRALIKIGSAIKERCKIE